MAFPTTAWTTGSLVFASQLNSLPTLIANTTLTSDAASIDFTGIPGHYGHLVLEIYARSSAAVAAESVRMRFNNDSAGNYDVQGNDALAGTVFAAEAFAATSLSVMAAPGSTAGANLFSLATITIPHYANALNNKSGISKHGYKTGTATTNINAGKIALFWRSSDAINRVTLFAATGNLKSGSRASLYGWA